MFVLDTADLPLRCMHPRLFVSVYLCFEHCLWLQVLQEQTLGPQSPVNYCPRLMTAREMKLWHLNSGAGGTDERTAGELSQVRGSENLLSTRIARPEAKEVSSAMEHLRQRTLDGNR